MQSFLNAIRSRASSVSMRVVDPDDWAFVVVFFFQAEDGIRDLTVTGETCALPISRAEQQAAERVRVAADFGVDDGAVLEVDRPGVVPHLGGNAQHAGLPAQVEQLEDVMDPELAQRAFDRHGYAASEAKMCCRSSAVRACMRARCANGPLGSSRVTRSHAWTASA